LASFLWGTDALHHFAVHQVADADKILLKTLIDFLGNTRDPPLEYSIQADVSTMTMSVPSHLCKIAFPTDPALEGTELLLAVDLDQQAQA